MLVLLYAPEGLRGLAYRLRSRLAARRGCRPPEGGAGRPAPLLTGPPSDRAAPGPGPDPEPSTAHAKEHLP